MIPAVVAIPREAAVVAVAYLFAHAALGVIAACVSVLALGLLVARVLRAERERLMAWQEGYMHALDEVARMACPRCGWISGGSDAAR